MTTPNVIPGSCWKHRKRGTFYSVLGIAKLQTAHTVGLADETPMVVYERLEDGRLSVRALEEFCDGRFEETTAGAEE